MICPSGCDDPEYRCAWSNTLAGYVCGKCLGVYTSEEVAKTVQNLQIHSQELEEALRKIKRVYERTMPGPRDALRDRVLEIIAALEEGK